MDRWLEEEILVKHEMKWMTLWFKNQADFWRERSKRQDIDLPAGHRAYAEKQNRLWNEFHRKACKKFGMSV